VNVRRLILAVLVLSCAVGGVLALSAVSAVAAAPQAPETKPASAETATTATVHGVLDPKAASTEVVVEYGFFYAPRGAACTEAYFAPESPGLVSGAQGEKVELGLTGLEPNTQYAVCLAVRNVGEEAWTVGSSVPFTTLPAPPTVGGESASANATEATLYAEVNPNNQSTTYSFEYSTQEKAGVLEGSIVKLNGAGALEGGSAQTASVSTGTALQPGTTYYYRVLAENAQSKKELKPAAGAVESFTTVPTPNTDPVSAIGANTATFNGHLTLVSTATQYSFDYKLGSGCTGESTTPTDEAGSGTGNASGATPVTGLQPDRLYTVCFVTSNAFGSDQGPPATFRTLPETSVTNVASSSATLHAVLDPEGSATTYRFQYGPSTTYGSQTPEASAGSGSSAVSVEAHVQGLNAANVYHYRVIATNAAHETFASEDQTFTTQASGGTFALPDDRQWEMVSPPDKHGALIEPIGYYGLIQASVDGSAFTYVATSPTEGQPRGYSNNVQVLSARSADGWSSQDIATSNDIATGLPLGGAGGGYKFFSSDLSRALIEPINEKSESLGFTSFPGEETSPHATERTDYLREVSTCQATPATCYTPLLTAANVTSGLSFGMLERSFKGATPDLSHVVFESCWAAGCKPLTKTTPEGGGGLYEWTAGKPPAEQLQLVSVLSASEGGGPAEAGASLGGEGGIRGEETRNAISENGSRVIWTAGNGHALYMRDTATEETVRLDVPEPECSKEGTCGSEEVIPKFEIASKDGSEVFFTDTQHLTVDSRGASNGGGEEPDLYACHMVEMEEAGHEKLKCDIADLTLDSNPDGERADVDGVLGASEDGSYVYFVANGVLGDGAEHGAVRGHCEQRFQTAQEIDADTCNLYVEHYSGSAWEAPRFIAVLSRGDHPDWWYKELPQHTSRSSPDGRYLAFMSDRDLAGYDTTDVNESTGAHADEEVYLYDALTNKIVCASCNPTGARPDGTPASSTPPHETLVGGFGYYWGSQWLAANVPGWTPYGVHLSVYQSRYLSDSGRLFFNSHEALVPQDVNGTWDVYEYEPSGVGTCTNGVSTFSERSGGCVGLISSGESSEESAFLDASEDGGDVFFMTASQLVPQDEDHSYDVYDAHECTTASPCFPASVEVPPSCTTEASCRPAPMPQPAIFGAPSSATFNGAGNAPPASATPAAKPKAKPLKCKKGLVKKKNKCVKRPKGKSKDRKASNERKASR
jgi:hypothetical protein